MKTHKNILNLVFSAIFILNIANAQVSVAPHTVILDTKKKMAEFYVENSSPSTQDIAIEFRFGYTYSDSTGKGFLVFNDTTTAKRFGITNWVKAFPKKFVLFPGQKQIVRLSGVAPDSLPEGTYWTRLITRSSAQQPQIDTVSKSQNIVTKINISLEQITTLLYRKGKVETSVDIDTIFQRSDSLGTYIVSKIIQKGNSPFLGSINFTIKDVKGNIVHKTSEKIAVNFQFYKAFNIKDKITAGTYIVECELVSERDDIDPAFLLKISPTKKNTIIVIR